MATAFISDPRCVEHAVRQPVPERADRLRAVHAAVREAGLITSPTPFPDFAMTFGVERAARPLIEIASSPIDEALVELVHTREMIEHVRRACAAGGVVDLGDTPVVSASWEAAMRAIACATTAVDAVMTGRANRAFAAARPPGHHAEPERAMGFCLFNNIAVAARYAQQKFGVDKIAIVDFDVHHGNGTQAAFETDPCVLFISMHQRPDTLYPGSGYAWERGSGAGEGYTLNLPMEPRSEDEDYFRAIDRHVAPVLEKFKPELLMLSAGFDAHAADPLAGMNLTDTGFGEITRRLVAIAEQCCEGKIVSVLEGGYDLLALGRSVVQHLDALNA